MNKVQAHIRLFDRLDIPEIAEAFQELGWNKPASQYERYLMEQVLKVRDMYIARVDRPVRGVPDHLLAVILCTVPRKANPRDHGFQCAAKISPAGNRHTAYGSG